jgi:DNA gyrase/topoisomerase IV subunit A
MAAMAGERISGSAGRAHNAAAMRYTEARMTAIAGSRRVIEDGVGGK